MMREFSFRSLFCWSGRHGMGRVGVEEKKQ